MEKNFYDQLIQIIDKEYVLENEPMSRHTTFRVGGNADYYVMPSSVESIQKLITLCKKENVSFYIIGNGSNVLVSDSGYRGVIIEVCRAMNQIQVEGTKIRVQAGALLSKVANEALKNSLTGFEFAAGIPGTLGGAVVMNAGAYGGEMKDVICQATVVTKEGELLTLKAEELELGYRTSIIKRKDYIVVEAVLSLKEGNQDQIKEYMDDLKNRRTTKQPLEYPSAGSTFKRPEGYFAGKLIEDAGLRGFTVGGAQVSEKHCGFVINKDHATAKDIFDLINQVSERVKENSGVDLEPEVKKYVTI